MKAGLLTVLNALPKGSLKEGGALEPMSPGGGGDGSEADGGAERGLTAASSGWTAALRDCWLPHVGSAATSQVCVMV